MPLTAPVILPAPLLTAKLEAAPESVQAPPLSAVPKLFVDGALERVGAVLVRDGHGLVTVAVPPRLSVIVERDVVSAGAA